MSTAAGPMAEQPLPEPLFWWWPADGGQQIALLSHDALFVTEPLAPGQVRDLELARRSGQICPEHLGVSPVVIPLPVVRSIENDADALKFATETGVIEVVAPPRILGGIE